MWQAGSAADYRAVLTTIVACATSKHVSAVAVNAGGTGYTVGDLLTVPHAGAYVTATAEVLVAAGGIISSVRLRNMGAYGIRATSAVIGVGGTGYVVGDIIEVAGGTNTERAKFQVATLAGSAVATVTLFETGGNYTATPANAAATVLVGPSTGVGTGCTLTVTYGTLVGTTGIATTGGTGTGCTLNLTLTATGWSAVRNLNSFSANSINTEKEVVLMGTVTGGDEPYVGIRTYTATVSLDTRWGLSLNGMTSHNIGVAYASQSGFGPASGTLSTTIGAYVPMFNATPPYWLSITPRRITGAIKTQGASILAYQTFYVGLMNPFATTVENPYPLFIAGTSGNINLAPDAATHGVTGLTEASGTTGVSGPIWFRRITDATWVQALNRIDVNEQRAHTIYPLGKVQDWTTSSSPSLIVTAGGGAGIVPMVEWWGGIGLNNAGVPTKTLFPTPMTGGDLFLLVPVTLIRATSGTSQTINDDVHGELDGVFWLSGTKTDGSLVVPEDTVTVGANRYRIMACAHRRERYSFLCFLEA